MSVFIVPGKGAHRNIGLWPLNSDLGTVALGKALIVTWHCDLCDMTWVITFSLDWTQHYPWTLSFLKSIKSGFVEVSWIGFYITYQPWPNSQYFMNVICTAIKLSLFVHHQLFYTFPCNHDVHEIEKKIWMKCFLIYLYNL